MLEEAMRLQKHNPWKARSHRTRARNAQWAGFKMKSAKIFMCINARKPSGHMKQIQRPGISQFLFLLWGYNISGVGSK